MPLKMFQPKSPTPRSQIDNIIAVAAGKGGVGKSSVAVNLARALKQLGRQVGILDVDVYGPSVRKMLPEDTPPQQNGEYIIPAVSQGIKMISMAYFRKENEAAVIRAPIANGIIKQFLQCTSWGELDDLIIDFPPGTGDIQLTLSQQANLTGAIMVTTPQEVALLDVRKAMHMFDQVRVPILGVVENMSYYVYPMNGEKIHIFGMGGGQRLADEAHVPLLNQIPIDPELCQSGDTGRSLFETHPSSPVAKAFIDLAKNTLARITALKSSQRTISPNNIRQKDAHTLTIEWSDGLVRDYRLSDIQKNCSCAKCVDETTGRRLLDPSTVDYNVKATRVTSVGRYAIKIDFTSGCSTGIYQFPLFRQLSGDPR